MPKREKKSTLWNLHPDTSKAAYIIQAQPTTVVNADETGAPKTAMQGGIERLRLSAQCLKKAMRTYLKEHYGDDSIRTNGLKEYLTKCLVEERNLDAKEAASIVSDFMKVIGISSSKEISYGIFPCSGNSRSCFMAARILSIFGISLSYA